MNGNLPRLMRMAGLVALPLGLAACSALMPAGTSRPSDAPRSALASPPDQWQAPSPGAPGVAAPAASDRLAAWWARWNDPVLDEWIAAAQSASPTVSAARARLAQAEVARTNASASFLPTVDGSASGQRGAQYPLPLSTIVQGGVQARWEFDLFGALRTQADAAEARVGAAQAQWHDARVSVAAEVAQQWTSLRACAELLRNAEADSASRGESARLSAIATRAGFVASAADALAQAAAAQGRARVAQQAGQCDAIVKGLAALTALPEGQIREKWRAVVVDRPQIAMFSVANPITALPAETLEQRPDLAAAARAVEAARADVEQAERAHYPRLALSGQLGLGRARVAGNDLNLTTWLIGPLSLSVPIFDGGRRRAAEQGARAAYEDAVLAYAAAVRRAVREVEDALVQLQSTARRSQEAELVARQMAAHVAALQDKQRAGLASGLEVQEARRNALGAEAAWIALQLERGTAWVQLYRATGGGWSDAPRVVAGS